MTQLNILDKSEDVVLSEKGATKLEKILNQPIGRNYKLVLVISKSTYEYISLILETIGSEYEEYINVVSNNKLDFGVVMVTKRDKTAYGAPEIGRDNVILLRRILGTVESDELDAYLTTNTPTYLIMSQDTFNALAKSTDNVDNYVNTGVAFYHSYSSIPVAITNFLELGVIDIVE